MKITEHRTKEILNWLDDKAADHTLLFEEMTLFRDAASLVRQLQAAEQSAWHAGLDAGRESVGAKSAEIETLKAEVAAQRARADAMAGEAIKHEDRAEQLRTEVARRVEGFADRAEQLEARAERLADALRRYRNEVPLGHQPHMLAHEVDALLRDQEEGKCHPRRRDGLDGGRERVTALPQVPEAR